MRITGLKLRNWCQHQEISVDFANGLNAVRGPNGSGKSNLLTAVVFALTGDFGRNPGVKVDNIYQLAGDKAKAGVVLELVHGQSQITIERNLRPSNQKLTISGVAEPLTKADEINAKIQEILGVNQRLLLDYVFVDQWKIFSFLDQSPSVRAKAFGELFNAARADLLHKVIGEFRIVVPVPAIDGDKVRVRIAETENEIKDLNLSLEAYNLLPEKWNYDEDPLRVLVTQFGYKRNLQLTMEKLKRNIEDVRSTILPKTQQINTLTAECLTWREALTASVADAQRAANALSSWDAYEAISQARASYENELRQITSELSTKELTPKPVDYCGPTYIEHERQLRHWHGELNNATKFVSTFDSSKNMANCPTCGTSVAQLSARLAEATVAIDTLRKETTELDIRIRKSHAYDNAVANDITCIGNLKNRQYAVNVRLAGLGTVEQPTGDKESWKELTDSYNELSEKVRIREGEITKLLTAQSHSAGIVFALEQELLDSQREYDSIAITSQQADEAQQQLNKTLTEFNCRNNLRYKLATKQQILKDDDDALKKFQLDERKANKLRRLNEHLDDVRNVFKELPQVAAQACLDSMIEEINDVLDKFEAPFRVLNVDDLHFTLKKHSGIITSAERLSGGEKAVFALAFRIVVNSKFAGSLGLLCLDEPTAGLDEDNLSCLEIALGRLRELSTSRGLQVVLITHDTGLDGLFDRVIKLPPVH